MDNGEWEPDPRLVECIQLGIYFLYHFMMSIIIMMCTLTLILACIPPSPPPNGYITKSFLSSQSNIVFVCQNSTPSEEVHIISRCNLYGKWVPNPIEFCNSSGLCTL